MPEGPEIHRAADKIRKALEGKVIEDIEITLPQFSGRENTISSVKLSTKLRQEVRLC